MSKNVIVLPTYIYVDTSIMGEWKEPCRLEKACVTKRNLLLTENLYFFVFNAFLIWINILFDYVVLHQLIFYFS